MHADFFSFCTSFKSKPQIAECLIRISNRIFGFFCMTEFELVERILVHKRPLTPLKIVFDELSLFAIYSSEYLLTKADLCKKPLLNKNFSEAEKQYPSSVFSFGSLGV